jgi:hypothetical protein
LLVMPQKHSAPLSIASGPCHVRPTAPLPPAELDACSPAVADPAPLPRAPAAGGAAAFAKKGSTKSLTAAGGSALILALAARTMVGSGAKGAIAVALAVSVLLTLVMSSEPARISQQSTPQCRDAYELTEPQGCLYHVPSAIPV